MLLFKIVIFMITETKYHSISPFARKIIKMTIFQIVKFSTKIIKHYLKSKICYENIKITILKDKTSTCRVCPNNKFSYTKIQKYAKVKFIQINFSLCRKILFYK